MCAMGSEFVDVSTPGRLVPDDPRAAPTNSVRLQLFLDTLHRSGGGLVWFPPGVWYLGRRGGNSPEQSVDAGDVVVYDDIILWFAGGAVLAPLGGAGVAERTVAARDEARRVRVEVHGAIEATTAGIFQATGDDRGIVLLSGDRIPEVDLTWWLADRLDLPVDRRPTVAARLQSAMDAAHRHRVRPLLRPDGALVRDRRGAAVYRRRPAIPMVCRTELLLDGPLTLGRREAEPSSSGAVFNDDPFVLRGERGPGTAGAGRATWRASTRLGPDAAMLSVRGVARFRIEGVNLHGNGLAARCLDVDYDGARGGAATLEGCTFQGASHTQVRVRRQPGDATPTAVSVLTLSRCRIETMDPALTSSPAVHTPPDREGLEGHDRMGVVFDGGEAVRLELRACIGGNFGANPLVSAVSGALSLRECELHCDRVHDLRPVAEINAQGRTTNGTDVVVERPTHRNARGWLEPASVAVRDLESQSWQMLMSYADVGVGPFATSTVVVANANATNAHGVVPGGMSGDEAARWRTLVDAPAIVWSSPQRSAHLTLAGVVVAGRGASTTPPPPPLRDRGRDGGCVVLRAGSDGTVLEAGLAARGASLQRALGATGSAMVVWVLQVPQAR